MIYVTSGRNRQIQPALPWPDDHPANVAVKAIFNRLVTTAATEVAFDTEYWKINIITMPGKPRESNS
jgi:hypothetical protein